MVSILGRDELVKDVSRKDQNNYLEKTSKRENWILGKYCMLLWWKSDGGHFMLDRKEVCLECAMKYEVRGSKYSDCSVVEDT